MHDEKSIFSIALEHFQQSSIFSPTVVDVTRFKVRGTIYRNPLGTLVMYFYDPDFIKFKTLFWMEKQTFNPCKQRE